MRYLSPRLLWAAAPRVRLVTGMPRRAPSKQPKSRASRPPRSGSDCLTSEAVSRELGANHSQNRKEHSRSVDGSGTTNSQSGNRASCSQ
jgi:hypothetical protein